VGVGPANQTDLCNLMDTCASQVADCDFTQSPDAAFATCKRLNANASRPQPMLQQFQGNVSGRNTSTYFINQTSSGRNGPFVLFFAPQFSGDYSTWACYYVFSYLATQGIATFTVEIPDAADNNRDNWNRVPSAGAQPYPYRCQQLDQYGPGCDNSSFGHTSRFLHDQRVEDVIQFAVSLGCAGCCSPSPPLSAITPAHFERNRTHGDYGVADTTPIRPYGGVTQKVRQWCLAI